MNVSGTGSRTTKVPSGNSYLVISGFQNDGNGWLTSADIAEKYLSELSASGRYNLISRLSSTGVLERRSNRIGEPYDYHYRLASEYESYVVPKEQAETAKRSYVRWTDQEKISVIKRAYLLRVAGAPGLRDSLEEAQKLLIKEGKLGANRYRNLRNTHHLTEIRAIMKGLAENGYKGEPEEAPAAKPVVAEPEPPAAEPQQEPVQEPAQEPVEAHKPAPATNRHRTAPDSTGALIETLIGRLEHSVTKILANAVEYGITRAFRSIMETEKGEAVFNAIVKRQATAAIQRHVPMVDTPRKERLKKVLLVGLPPNQLGDIAREFEGLLDLRVWTAGQNRRLLKTLIKNVDITVVLTDRLRHSDSELVTDSKSPYVMCTGGVGAVKDKLTELYVE